MRTKKIYDLPTRLIHWMIAILFVVAFYIAKTVDDESPAFSYHMLAGLLLAFTVILRLVWGFIGTKYAKFSSFALQPKDLVNYFLGIFSKNQKKWTGHNPASSWASLMMFLLVIALATTGFLMTTGSKETFEDVHELLANLFLLVVLAHVAGVILHGLKHRDAIALSMLDGKKSTDLATETEITSQKPWVAIIFATFITLFAANLFQNYDSNNRKLIFFGKTLSLGESENEEKNGQENESSNEKEEDDD